MWKGKWLILNRSILWLYSFHSLHTTWNWQEDFFFFFIMRAGYESMWKGCYYSLKVIGKRYLFVENSIQGHGVGSQSRAFPYRLLYGNPPPPPKELLSRFFPNFFSFPADLRTRFLNRLCVVGVKAISSVMIMEYWTTSVVWYQIIN